MDQFYSDIYESVMYQWLLGNQEYYAQKHITIEIDQQYAQRLIFTYKNLTGIIEFWGKQHIIEETILNKDQELLFYLHYKMNNLSGFKNFIYTFFQQLLSYPQSRYIAVSCTSDVTSSVFIQKLQELSDLMNMPYHFETVPAYQIEKKYQKYDMILLAPQVAYLEPMIKSFCQNQCIVQSIDPLIFATYDYQKTLDLVQKHFIA